MLTFKKEPSRMPSCSHFLFHFDFISSHNSAEVTVLNNLVKLILTNWDAAREKAIFFQFITLLLACFFFRVSTLTLHNSLLFNNLWWIWNPIYCHASGNKSYFNLKILSHALPNISFRFLCGIVQWGKRSWKREYDLNTRAISMIDVWACESVTQYSYLWLHELSSINFSGKISPLHVDMVNNDPNMFAEEQSVLRGCKIRRKQKALA